MTAYLPLIILVAVVGIISIVLDRRWQARNASKEDSSNETNTGLTARVGDSLQGSWRRLRGKPTSEAAAEFRSWAAQNLKDDKALRDWLTSLSDEGIEALTTQLAGFCADLNLELSWLASGELDVDAELRKAAEDVVISYCSACHQAALGQNDLTAFRTYLAFDQKPRHRKYREFSHHLYEKLVEGKVVSSPPISELLLASDRARHGKVIAGIREAAEADRPAFNRILKQVLAAEAEAAEMTEGTEAAKPAKAKASASA